MNLPKKTALTLFILLFSCAPTLNFLSFNIPVAHAAVGTTYYVDATNGLDTNNGTDQSTPWQTINKVNNSTFQPGDSILFKREETWREQLTVPSSGADGNPITFGAYGTGDNPIISGADIVSSWSNAVPVPASWTGGSSVPYGAVFVAFKGSGSWTLVNSTFGNGTANPQGTAAFTNALTNGSLILVGISAIGTATIPTPTDTAGNTYTRCALTGTPTWAAGANRLACFYAINTSTITNNVVQVANTSGRQMSVHASEWTGQATTSPDDTGLSWSSRTSTSGSTDNFKTGNLTPSASGELLFGFIAAASPVTPGTGFTELTNDSGLGEAEYQISTGGDVWNATVSNRPNVVIFNGDLGIPASNLASVTSTGEYYYSGSTLSVYDTSDPGSTIEVGNRESAIDTNGKSNVTIQDLHLYGANGTNLYGNGNQDVNGADVEVSINSSNILIKNNILDLAATFGVRVTGGDGITISGNSISNIFGDSGFTLGDGIDVDGYLTFDGSSWTHTGPSTNITVTGNTLTGYFDRNGIAFEDVDGGTISNNTITFGGPWSAIDLEPQSSWVINNVTIDDNAVTLAIPPVDHATNPAPTTGIGAAVLAQGGTLGNVAVTGNSLDLSNLSSSNGIQMQCNTGSLDECVASSNTITNLGSSALGIVLSGSVATAANNAIHATAGHIGFYLESSSIAPTNNFSVIGNTVDGVFNANGIVVLGASTTAQIAHNIFANTYPDNDVPPSTGKGVYVGVTTANSGVTARNNIITGWQNAVALNGTLSTINIFGNDLIGWSNGLLVQSGNTFTTAFSNNIVAWTGSSASSVSFINDGGSASEVLSGDNNLYYAPNDANAQWKNGSNNLTTLSTWYSSSGMDTDSFIADPMFTNYGANDFTLTSASPAINAGADLGSPYNLGLDPTSSWPDGVKTLSQDVNGSGWEIGAYVYKPSSSSSDGGGSSHPPVSFGDMNVDTGSTTASLSFSSSIPAHLSFLLDSSSFSTSTTDFTTDHALSLSDLTPNTTYSYSIQLTGESGQTASFRGSFTTLAADGTYSASSNVSDSSASTTTPASSSLPLLTRTLSFGSHDPEVLTLQQFLIPLYLASGNDTGYFGPLTQAAVEKYQTAHNIVLSGTPLSTGFGQVGPRTRAMINSELSTTTATTTNQTTIESIQEHILSLTKTLASLMSDLMSSHVKYTAQGLHQGE